MACKDLQEPGVTYLRARIGCAVSVRAVNINILDNSHDNIFVGVVL